MDHLPVGRPPATPTVIARVSARPLKYLPNEQWVPGTRTIKESTADGLLV
jgi:hypothetical protein